MCQDGKTPGFLEKFLSHRLHKVSARSMSLPRGCERRLWQLSRLGLPPSAAIQYRESPRRMRSFLEQVGIVIRHSTLTRYILVVKDNPAGSFWLMTLPVPAWVGPRGNQGIPGSS